ncbi:unnamed protein product [Periconia digitata]|uniref:Biogenesis of lysosome-related organelles complex 1 subunit KXD1 n=1 Tax=Periconia digitata TaxID=1303443 RepID=A0A9W4UHP4_9PLEO|nr:unnamed protein product [Periconia digitata]
MPSTSAQYQTHPTTPYTASQYRTGPSSSSQKPVDMSNAHMMYSYPNQPHHPSYPSSSPLPIHMPQKPGYYYPQPNQQYSHVSASPPEAPHSATTSGVASYEPSATSSSYAGSASDYDSASGGAAGGVDLLEYMGERLNGSLDSTRLDRSLATQAKASGELNAKHRELLQLQALAQQRLAGVKVNFAEGMRTARGVQKDLQWTQQRVDSLNNRAAKKYPEQFKAAQRRYPAPVDY